MNKATTDQLSGAQRTALPLRLVEGLDAQLAELIETVWACERAWARESRIDTAVKYGLARN
jgi:hypothetical protein